MTRDYTVGAWRSGCGGKGREKVREEAAALGGQAAEEPREQSGSREDLTLRPRPAASEEETGKGRWAVPYPQLWFPSCLSAHGCL